MKSRRRRRNPIPFVHAIKAIEEEDERQEVKEEVEEEVEPQCL